ncbi:MAG: hypothetical protein HKN87_16315 [Saprospiraceae bacterium]|nr:hypothetical protein [Saprospiraceae bacterium]
MHIGTDSASFFLSFSKLEDRTTNRYICKFSIRLSTKSNLYIIRRRDILLALLLLNFVCIQAQDVDAPRFFEMSMQNAPLPQQVVNEDLRSFHSSAKETQWQLESRLRYPISLKGRTKIIGEVSYDHRGLYGFYSLAENENEEVHLHKLSMGFMSLHQLSPRSVLKSRIGIKQSSSQLSQLNGRSTLYSTTHLLEQDIDGGKVGFGARIAYRNRLTVIPIFLYERTWANGWSFDALLPVQVTAEKLLDADKRIIMGLKGSSDNYFVANDLDFVDESSNFRRIGVNAMIAYEKQITPIFGANIEAGASVPLFSGLYKLDNRWSRTHNFQERVTPYLKVGIFCAIGH